MNKKLLVSLASLLIFQLVVPWNIFAEEMPTTQPAPSSSTTYTMPTSQLTTYQQPYSYPTATTTTPVYTTDSLATTTQPIYQYPTASTHTIGVCPEVFAPVCGIDGKTYSNKCHAVNVQIVKEGPCDGARLDRSVILPVYPTQPTRDAIGIEIPGQQMPRHMMPMRPTEQMNFSQEGVIDFRNRLQDSSQAIPDFQRSGHIFQNDSVDLQSRIELSKQYLQKAEESLKQKDEQTAKMYFEKARHFSPHQITSFETGNVQNLAPEGINKMLMSIKDGLDKTAAGFEKSESIGITIDPEQKAVYERAREQYNTMQSSFTNQDYTKVGQVLHDMQGLRLGDRFGNFGNRTPSAERFARFNMMVEMGLEHINRGIEQASRMGADTGKLINIKIQIESILKNIQNAKEQGDQVLVTQLFDELKNLREESHEAMESVFKEAGKKRFQEEMSHGLKGAQEMISNLKKMIADLETKKVNTEKLKEFLAEMESLYSKTVAASESNDMSAVEENMHKGMVIGRRFHEYMRDFVKTKPSFDFDDDFDEEEYDIPGLEEKLSEGQVREFDKVMRDINNQDVFKAKKLFTSLDSQTLELILQEKKRHKDAMKNILAVSLKMPEQVRTEFVKDKLDILEEVNQFDAGKKKMIAVQGIAPETVKKVDDLKKTLSSFNFSPETSDQVLEGMKNFNDKLLTVTDPLEAKSYINTFDKEVERFIKAGTEDKFKKGMIPFKNVDDNNPLFDETMRLKKDGAISGDKQGNIDFNKKLSRGDFADILTKSIDKTINFKRGKGGIKEADAVRAVLDAYKIKTDFNKRDLRKLSGFVKKLDLMDTNPRDLNTPLTQEEAIELIGRAEEKWGNERN